MAPTPPTSTWPHRHRHRHRHTFFLPLALLLAIVRPASSQSQLLQPPPGAATVSSAFSPPSPPADGGVDGRFAVTTSLLFIGLIVALFVLGFFSAYLRRCSGSDTTHARRGGALAANAAVAAAFAASSGRRRAEGRGLDAAAMEALPVLTYATARAVKAGRGGALECAVCLSAFDDAGEKLRLLPGCCHVFHAACIDAWLAAHVTCPVCRADLSDPAVADAGHLLAADLAAAHQADAGGASTDTDTVVVIVNADGSSTPAAGAGEDTTSSESDEEAVETAEELVDRFTLRLPERLRREIDEAKRLRRALSAVTASSAALQSGGGGPLSSAALRTMSAAAARPSRRWSGLFRALSGSRRMVGEPPEGHHRRVVPLPTDGEVEVVVVRERDDVDKYYAHSLSFAGFVIDGDVAAGDWNPEVFQVSTGVPAVVATSQR